MDNIGRYIRSKLDNFKQSVSQTGQALVAPRTQAPVNNNFFNIPNKNNVFSHTLNSVRNTYTPIRSPIPEPVKIKPFTSTVPGMINTAKIKGYGALSALENDISKGVLYKTAPEFVNTFKQAPQTVGTFLGKVGEAQYLQKPQQDLLNKTVELRTTAAQMRRSGNLKGAKNLENTAGQLQKLLSKEADSYAKFREESKYKVPAAAARTALMTVGAKQVNPSSIAVSAGLSGGIAKAAGEDVPTAIARSTARLPEIMGIVRLGDPVAQKIAGSVYTKIGGKAVPQLVARGITGLENVIESITLDKLAGIDRKVHEYVTDFVIGAALSNTANDNVKREARRIFANLQGINKKQIAQATDEIVTAVGQTRNKLGQYENMPKTTTWQGDGVGGVGSYKQLGEIDQTLLTDLGGAGVGSLAGIEKDEQGNYRYNPVKGATGAALGFGARRGAKLVKKGLQTLENTAYDSVLAKDLKGEGLGGDINRRVLKGKILDELQPQARPQTMSEAASEIAARHNGVNNLDVSKRTFDIEQKIAKQNEARMAREFGYTPIDDIVRKRALQSGEIDFSAKIGGKPEVDLLVQEARKYKSAEEFVKGQTNAQHGTNTNFTEFKKVDPSKGQAIYLSEVGQKKAGAIASRGGKLMDVAIDESRVKTFDPRSPNKELNNIVQEAIDKVHGKGRFRYDPEASIATGNIINKVDDVLQSEVIKLANKKGYNDFRFYEPSTQEYSRAITDSSLVKTKSQLTDIWNKANAGGNIGQKAQAPQVVNQAVNQSQSKVTLKVGRKLPAQQSLQVPGSSSPNITPKRTTIQDIERQIYGSETGVTAQGSKKSVGIIADNLRKIERGASNLVSRGLESENNIIRNVAGLMQDLAGGAGKSTGQVEARAQYRGGVDYATKVASDAQKHIYTLLGNNEKSLARVHAVLDPQISKIKVSEQNLTPPEREALGTLRILSDFVNDTNYKNGFISEKQWASNRGGKYIARAYEVFDYPPEVADFIKNKDMRFDLNPFKTRKEVTDWKVENAITDPAYLMGKRIQQTMFNGEVKKYTEWARKSGLTSNVERPGFVQLSDSKAYGEMAGKWIRKDALEDVKGFFVTHDVGQKAYEILNWYDRNPIRRTQKMLKTVFNPAVRLGNRTGNYVFAWLNGINPVSFAKNTDWANGAIKRNDPLYRFAMQSGLIGTDVTKADIARVSAELSREIKEPGLLKAAIQELQNSYGRVDDASKLASLKTWIDRGVDPAEAINRTRRGFQDYNMVGFLYDIGAKLPILGNPFVRFSSESVRIAKNAAIDHPIRTVGTIGAWALFTDVMSRMQGETTQDRETREQRVGASHLPFTNISTNIQTPWGEVNVSRLLGFSTTFTPDGATYTDVSKYAPIQNPLDVRNYGSDPMLGPIISLGTDTDFRGKSISDPNQSKYVGSTLTQSEKNMNRVGYLARSYLPPTATDLYNVGAAAQGKPNVYGQVKSVPQAVARVYPGVKVEQYGAEEAEAARKREAYFNTQKMERLEIKAKAIQNDLETGKITEDQAKKRNTQIIKEMIPDPKYIDDKDSPKGIIDKLKLYIKAGGTDLPATLYALKTGQPIRKVENDIVVLKRMQDLGKLDFGDTNTQIDHDVPLQYGGSNYDNTLPIADNKQKTIAQKKLYKQYEQGKITKTELINGIDNWKEVPLTTTEKKTAAALPNGKYYEYKDDKGANRKIVIEKVELPKMTGNTILDKKLLSTYTQQLTTNANNVVKLYKLGKLSAQEAEKMLTEFESQSSKTKSLKTSKKAKKPKKLKLPKIKRPAKLRLKKIKLKTVTVKTPKLKKFKEPKFVNLSKLKA